ncbi:putative fatty acyl-CoA reductase CG5065 [Onthophagus taurus]|uniref:putative fatty acyl-CoA reductase CG5065 n=1 Tax=Onthophagus taurus TaxID=166361 RepID=UPI000C20B356|nr:putative fatty acyl-CoA reductase CG5065 [Onthophagus taurus]
MDFSKSVIGNWYKGKKIFITGGTGFMGKVLIEKLLFACREVDTLYVLMRSKRGKSMEKRLEAMWELPAFERVKGTDENLLSKVIPLNGDLSSENLGLSPEDVNKIVNEVSVVFHFAATLKLEATLKDAIEMNTSGTQRVIDLAKKIKNLDAFVHLSTAFCSADLDVFEEKIYESPDNPRDVIKMTQWMKNEAVVKATPSIIAPHPNTYTYSKRLAESLVANELENMRVCIVRPSIVTPAGLEPVPGWVDSLNGPIGILVAGGKGVLRTMHCKAENSAHVVPVDIAINSIIVAAWKLGSAPEKPKEVPVYNLTNDDVLKLTWGDVLNVGRRNFYDYPFEMQVWYPDGTLQSNYYVHFFWTIFIHWLPALLIDGLMFIFRQKRFMIRIQKKIYDGLELLQFFTTREWKFKSENFLALVNELNPTDKELYPMDYHLYPIDKYMVYCILGARQYTMKENLKSLGRCRVQLRILYVVDKLFKLLLMYGFFCLAWSYSDTVKYLVEIFREYAKNLPILSKALSEKQGI